QQDVQDPRRRSHQHPDDLDLRDQDFGGHRRKISGARGARAASGVRAGERPVHRVIRGRRHAGIRRWVQTSTPNAAMSARAVQSAIMPLAPGTRWMLIAAALLVLSAGLDLFIFPDRTDTMFAWTMEPAWTAAFLGANYLAAGVIELGAALQRTW